MRSVMDQMPVGVLMIEAETERVLLRNKKFDEITLMPQITFFREYEKYYIATRRDGTKYEPEDCPIIRSIIFDETIIDEEMIFKHENGQLALSVNSAPVLDREGKLIAGVALYGDITARSLVATHVEFLSEASAVLVSSLDKKTIMQGLAELAVRNISDGCSIDLINEKGKAELIAMVYKDPAKLQYARAIREKGYLDTESKIGAGAVLRRGHSILYHKIRPVVVHQLVHDKEYSDILSRSGLTSAMIVPLMDHGAVVGSMTFTSAREDRLFDKKDLELVEELAKRVELTLENMHLYLDATKAVSARDDFISMASHELRTPLTTMIMHIHLMQKQIEKNDRTEISGSLEEINGQLFNLSYLINQMLDLSRIQGRKIAYKKENFLIAKLVREIVEREQKISPDHRVLLTLCNEETMVCGDEERIGHVIANLISNAVKFSPPGDIIITCKKEAGIFSLSVEDRGIGIPEEHLQKVFERFHQVSPVENKSYPGLGIGLYIASEIIRDHGGKIWAESKMGKGSTFQFTIPETH
jgi:signal transduction histidine kinase